MTMDKEELLQELSEKLTSGEIKREEVLSALSPDNVETNKPTGEENKKPLRFSATRLFYILGATIALIGILFFIAQVWDLISSFGRILVTLGFGLLIAAMGSILLKQKPDTNLGAFFHIIGGALIPSGILITLFELDVDINSLWVIAVVFGVTFAFYLLLGIAHKHTVFTFFAILNGTLCLYALFGVIVDGPAYDNENIYAYFYMMIGAVYLALAYAFRVGWNKYLVSILYILGGALFLGATFSQVFDSIAWQLIYFLILSGGFLLSVYAKKRYIFAISIIFLVAHIVYITNEYFADSIGWPISLLILGFLFIGLGYAFFTINKRYIKTSN